MAPPDPSVTRIEGPWRHLDVHANGIRFHVVEASGEADGPPATARPLVMLLHGFGSFWWSWRHQLRGLRGARVVAVDLRGYGGSDKPPRGYDGWTMAGDTAGLGAVAAGRAVEVEDVHWKLLGSGSGIRSG